MGQYYVIVNRDKKEFIHPHKLNQGLKLMEFGTGGLAVNALAVLLADGNGRGGGDLDSKNPIVGSWAGDRIVIAGDYADGRKFLEDVPEEELQAIANDVFTEGYREAKNVTLYHYAQRKYKDVSAEVLAALLDDPYISADIEREQEEIKNGKGFAFEPFVKILKEAKKIQRAVKKATKAGKAA